MSAANNESKSKSKHCVWCNKGPTKSNPLLPSMCGLNKICKACWSPSRSGGVCDMDSVEECGCEEIMMEICGG